MLNSLQYHDALKISDDRLCKIKMIGEIRQNFTEASASVGLILATALKYMLQICHLFLLYQRGKVGLVRGRGDKMPRARTKTYPLYWPPTIFMSSRNIKRRKHTFLILYLCCEVKFLIFWSSLILSTLDILPGSHVYFPF